MSRAGLWLERNFGLVGVRSSHEFGEDRPPDA